MEMLEAIGSRVDGLSLTELARQTGMSKRIALRYVKVQHIAQVPADPAASHVGEHPDARDPINCTALDGLRS